MASIKPSISVHHLNRNSVFTEPAARVLFKDILDGLRYLHETVGVAHLDLKLENVMIDSNSRARIIDFGLARPLASFTKTSPQCGSHPYCSPEMLKNQIVTSKTDIWSLGILLYTIVVGHFLFCETDESLLTSRILFDEVTFPTTVSNEFQDLIQSMLEKDPTKRITLSGIASHPWLHHENREVPHLMAVSVPFFPCLLRPSIQSVKFGSNQSTGMRRPKGCSPVVVPASGSRRLVYSGARGKLTVR
jgi:serine/threonine protein kinase